MAKFMVTFNIRGSLSREIEAESVEDATARIEAEMDEDGPEPEIDQVDDFDYDVRELHHVSRDGKELWTTYVRPNDTRIESPTPTERESA